jgi:basic amino acid/polyamine antiporter, APA family
MSKSVFRKKDITSIVNDGSDGAHGGGGLKRILTARDLTFFGIAAILGAGSFSSLGSAVFSGGPGVIVLFLITAVACGFTAFCYSEFASRIPVSGSAYTYAYASFGELFAWIIGWALIMEYSIGNIYVSYSWSDYFTSFLQKVGVTVPGFLCTSYMEVKHAIVDGTSDEAFLNTWNNCPKIFGLRFIVDLPAFLINIIITYLVYRGVKESKNFSNVMVVLKMVVVALVIIVGGYCIFANNLFSNWLPTNAAGTTSFMPNGFSGVMAAVSGVFFAYIGFDAVSVLAEESKNPQKDLPRGMIYSLVICTVVYILLTLVLTGAVNYNGFENVSDPLAFIFEKQNLNVGWMQFLVAICAVIAMTSVLLVFQMGQPRIWMSISRDGLLPAVFQKIHKKYQTPSFATILTGAVVGLPILFTDKTFVLDFTSIATLFAFVLVCGGVLLIPRRAKEAGKFNLPYVNSKFIFPLLLVVAIGLLTSYAPNYFKNLFTFNLHTSTNNEIVNTYVNDKLAPFKKAYLINKQDLIFLNKKTSNAADKALLNALADSNNNTIKNINAAATQQFVNHNGFKNNTTDFFALQVPSALVLNAALPKLDANIFSSFLTALNQPEDSAINAKVQNQAALYNLINNPLDTLQTATKTDIIKTFNSSFDNLGMTVINAERAKKLDAQIIFNITSLIFWAVCIFLAVFGFKRNYSLIPLLGLVSCMYLLTGMSLSNWLWFILWLILGLVVYFLYGYKKSILAK